MSYPGLGYVGVEAQTLTVWRQALEYDLPKIIFLNKMDKASASIANSMNSIVTKLKCEPILIQEPVYSKHNSGSGSGLLGMIDIIQMKRYIFDQKTRGNEMKIGKEL